MIVNTTHKYSRLQWDLNTQEVWMEGSNDMKTNTVLWHQSHPDMTAERFELYVETLAGAFMNMNRDNVAERPDDTPLH